MNTGVYGTVRASDVNPVYDVEIFYYYRPTRGSESTEFLGGYKTLDPSSCLMKANSDELNWLSSWTWKSYGLTYKKILSMNDSVKPEISTMTKCLLVIIHLLSFSVSLCCLSAP